MKDKMQRLSQIKKQIIKLGLHIVDEDFVRPWGGFFRIADSDIKQFILQFFPEMQDQLAQDIHPLSPKILCIQPLKQMSWQYHNRRSEIWKLLDGKAAYKISKNDSEGELNIMKTCEAIIIEQGMRHRLIGLNEWGIIAEIWQHIDANQPSNEVDIIRLQDDYGRLD